LGRFSNLVHLCGPVFACERTDIGLDLFTRKVDPYEHLIPDVETFLKFPR